MIFDLDTWNTGSPWHYLVRSWRSHIKVCSHRRNRSSGTAGVANCGTV